MATLRMQETEAGAPRAGADLFACTYSADGAHVLTAGWDGFLRLWEAATGVEVRSLQTGSKPLSCCATSPDGRQWLAGSIEGAVSVHDAATLELVASVQAHTRPVSSIRYACDGWEGEATSPLLATSSWDGQVVLRRIGQEREARVLHGHKDIVAGCRFTGDGARLLSWSYDGTLRLWNVAAGREERVLTGHEDRVTAAAPSPDGRYAASGGRDGVVHLWDLSTGKSVRSIRRPAEVRACLFLLDGSTIVAVDAAGGVALLTTPDLEITSQAPTGARAHAADLSPTGMSLALACEDGQVRRIALDGLEGSSLVVTATHRTAPVSGILGRFLGKPRVAHVYQYSCPVCRRTAEVGSLPTQPFPCPGCRHKLHISGRVRQFQDT